MVRSGGSHEFAGSDRVESAARIYKPLEATIPEIRVSKLLPSPDFEASIEGQLIHRPLHGDDHSYEALSYVWGVPELVIQIMLSGTPFPVTRNLDMALRYLRLQEAHRTPWVDALCINQTDLDERSQQV